LVLIAHLADIHLGKKQYHLGFRENDIYELFNDAIDIILREHVKTVVISGDLFDEPRPKNKALKIAIDGFKKLEDRGIKIILVPGDHERLRTRDMLSLLIFESVLDNVVVLGAPKDKERVDTEYIDKEYGIAFYALPFFGNKQRARKVMLYFLSKAEAFFNKNNSLKKVLVAHYGVEEILPIDAVLSISDIPSVDYAAFGHVHKRVITYIPRGGVLGYPGSIDIIDRREISDWIEFGKGFYIVDLSMSPDKSMVHKIDLNVRPQYIIETDQENVVKELDKLAGTLTSNTKKPIIVNLVLHIKKGSIHNLKRLYQLYQDTMYLRIHPVFVEEEKNIDYSSLEVFNEKEILGRYMGASEEVADLLYDLVERLAGKDTTITAEEIMEIMRSIYEKWPKARNITKITFYEDKGSREVVDKRKKSDSRGILKFIGG